MKLTGQELKEVLKRNPSLAALNTETATLSRVNPLKPAITNPGAKLGHSLIDSHSKKYVIYGQPVPKPRQTRSDRWKKRPCVMRYREFADRAREVVGEVGDVVGLSAKFYFSMPSSWSGKKKGEMLGKPHRAKPDLDNCVKAVMDALLPQDSGVYSFKDVSKLWCEAGQERIELELF